jgi:hypothetical protein
MQPDIISKKNSNYIQQTREACVRVFFVYIQAQTRA